MEKIISLPSRIFRNTWQGLLHPPAHIWQHRELVMTLVRRDFRIRTSGSLLGVLWMLLQPGLQIIGFWFLLEVVLKAKYPGRVPFLDYFLVGMLVWMLVSDTLSRTVAVLRDMASIYQRALFPLEILPLLPLITNLILFPLLFFTVVLFLEGLQSALQGTTLLFLLALWLIPICYLLAISGLFLRDLLHLVPFLITIAMYATPILYMPEMLPEFAQHLLIFNPFSDLLAIVHGVVQDMPMSDGNWLRLLAIWLLLLAPSWLLFRLMKPQIRDML